MEADVGLERLAELDERQPEPSFAQHALPITHAVTRVLTLSDPHPPRNSTETSKRPFVFAADKQLLVKAETHLNGMVTYHQIDNAQLQQKLGE